MQPDLEATAQALVAEGKGILAADESDSTIKKRFDAIGVDSTEENRRAYRDLLFTTPGFEEYISGVILFDETIRQSSADGTPFPQLLERRGVIPGIKLDHGAKPLAHAPGETITEGLDGLRERIEEYVGLGARFAKWRAVISIGKGIPSEYCLWTNAHALARYAAPSQEGRPGPGRGAGDRLPLRRPVGRGRDGQPERDQRARAASVGVLVLVRSRPAGAGPESVARRRGERRGGTEGVLPAGEVQQRRPLRLVRPRDGGGGRRVALSVPDPGELLELHERVLRLDAAHGART